MAFAGIADGLAGLSDESGVVEFLSDRAKSAENWFAAFWPGVSQTRQQGLNFNSFADVAQRQSTAFVKRGLWVQIPPSALTLFSHPIL